MDLDIILIGLLLIAIFGPLVVYFDFVDRTANILVWPIRLTICAVVYVLERITDVLSYVDLELETPAVKLFFICVLYFIFPNVFLKFWLSVPLLILIGMMGVLLRHVILAPCQKDEEKKKSEEEDTECSDTEDEEEEMAKIPRTRTSGTRLNKARAR